VDGVELGISVLLTRPAGPGQPVTAQVRSAATTTTPSSTNCPGNFQLTLSINATPQGAVAFDSDSLLGELNPAQTQALLAALTRKSSIEFVRKGNTWALSDTGAAAVLLKMDEFQGRLGTPGALIRPGTQPESKALPRCRASSSSPAPSPPPGRATRPG
jgi:hypothetical protein